MTNQPPIAKNIITGIIIGFLGTVIGTTIWILCLSDFDITTTIKNAWSQNVLGAILAAGSLPNIGAFFLFLKQQKNYHARGVVIATLIVAFFIMYLKLR